MWYYHFYCCVVVGVVVAAAVVYIKMFVVSLVGWPEALGCEATSSDCCHPTPQLYMGPRRNNGGSFLFLFLLCVKGELKGISVLGARRRFTVIVAS